MAAPNLKSFEMEPLAQWFSLSLKSAYDALSRRVVAIIPEIDIALREGKLGPHILPIVMTPLPPDVQERIEKLREKSANAHDPSAVQ